MRVLVIAHYQNDGSPTASFIHDQIKELKQLSLEIIVIVPIAYGKTDYYKKKFSEAVIKANIDGIEHYFVRYLSFSKYGKKRINIKNAIKSINRYLKKTIIDFNPDIVHAHTIGLDSGIAGWIKELIHKPVVVTIHGSDLTSTYNCGDTEVIKKWCEHLDAIVCVGTGLKDILLRCEVSKKTLVIHNGFNIGNICNTNQKKRNSLIQVCNLVSSKNTDVTILALSKILERHPDVSLTIIGNGPKEKELKELCKKLKINKSVVFLGQLSNKDVLDNMAKSEIFVMVSSPEGFGIVYLEAMASKCLTIGTKNEGISDIIVSGENGILLPARDVDSICSTVDYYINHREEAIRISEKGYTTAIENTWRENAIKYYNLYKELQNNNE